MFEDRIHGKFSIEPAHIKGSADREYLLRPIRATRAHFEYETDWEGQPPVFTYHCVTYCSRSTGWITLFRRTPCTRCETA